MVLSAFNNSASSFPWSFLFAQYTTMLVAITEYKWSILSLSDI